MAVEFHIDKKGDLLWRTVTGDATPDEIIESLEASMRHPDYRQGMPSLIDMRASVSNPSSADVRKLAEFLTARGDILKGMQAAVVVSRKVDYGLTRMLQALADTPHFDVAVFYDLEEAKRWLQAVRGSSPPVATIDACASGPGVSATAE